MCGTSCAKGTQRSREPGASRKLSSSILRTIVSCEVCGKQELAPVLVLGSHPLCDDLVPVGDSRVCEEFPIEIKFCKVCWTAHQAFQVPKVKLFPPSYHYRARFTQDVLNGMRSLVRSSEVRFGRLNGKMVLDIGTNDGSLLDVFRSRGAVTVGIEPTDAAREAAAKGHTLYQEYLSVGVVRSIVSRYGNPDIITFTNVFAHIDDLGDAIESLQNAMGPETVVIVENHYLMSIVEKNQFDTFYHEHPRSYSFRSFEYIARRLGLVILDVEFPDRYGGNIRVYLGSAKRVTHDKKYQSIVEKEERLLGGFADLQRRVSEWRVSKRRFLSEQVDRFGALNAKAFPGRAAILLKLLDVDEKIIRAVHEKPGSQKIGYYVPGTRIPIVSDVVLFKGDRGPGPLVNLAWHISDEIRDYLRANGYVGEVVDIVSREDFVQ